jgi:hypothetical protein
MRIRTLCHLPSFTDGSGSSQCCIGCGVPRNRVENRVHVLAECGLGDLPGPAAARFAEPVQHLHIDRGVVRTFEAGFRKWIGAHVEIRRPLIPTL